MRLRFYIISALLLFSSSVSASTIDQLKEAVVTAGGSCVLSGCTPFEGVVISDWRKSDNTTLNTQLSFDKVDITKSLRTAYVVSIDGGKGMRIEFTHASFNNLCKGDKVVLNPNGCAASVDEQTGALTLKGLLPINVLSYSKGDPALVPVKQKRIAELGNDDIYTLVTITDLEFVFKSGTYANVRENYSQWVQSYHYALKGFNGRMDGSGTLLRDDVGDCIWMHVNTSCDWRREALPEGSGSVTGIIVASKLRRYGGNVGAYSIRPAERSDISIDNKRKSSSWTRLTAWEIDGSVGTLDFEKAGTMGNLYKHPVSDDRIYSDTGADAYLWTDTGAKIHLADDDDRLTPDENGLVKNGSIIFNAPTADWYEWSSIGTVTGTRSFFIEFSSKKAKSATALQLSFRIAAGLNNMDSSWMFPARWKVQCSVDGGDWIDCKDFNGDFEFWLRPLPCWDKKNASYPSPSTYYRTQYDCGIGIQPHLYSLPAEAIGKEKVIVRITPAGPDMFWLRSNPSSRSWKPSTDCQVKKTTVQTSNIRFGSIAVDYK